MSERLTFEYCEQMVADFEKVIETPVKSKSSVYYTGVDLGTACVVIAVLDENKQPVAGAYRYADVVKDGMVVDYIGAVRIVRELKEEIEEKLGTELIYAAGAIPPGTDELDGGAVKNELKLQVKEEEVARRIEYNKAEKGDRQCSFRQSFRLESVFRGRASRESKGPSHRSNRGGYLHRAGGLRHQPDTAPDHHGSGCRCYGIDPVEHGRNECSLSGADC